jgi:hypothetical protein
MSDYTPDNWVILKIDYDGEIIYKVLAGWSGGYLDGDAWRMNSGITSVEKQAYLYGFYGQSGSVYWCHQGTYRLTMAIAGVYNQLKEHFGDKVEMMPEDTNWMEIEW